MAAPVQSSMPQFAQLGYNTALVLEALDPTTGDPVDGVTVSAVDIWADVAVDGAGGGGRGGSGDGSTVIVGPYMLVTGPSA